MESKVAASGVSPGPQATTARSGIRGFHVLLFSVWLLIAGYFLVIGWSYYTLPLQERPFAEAYDTYKPGGVVGLNLGILGTLCMAFGVLTYSVRKRVRRFRKIGKLRNWLSFHIFLCTLGPFLILLHTSFKVNGIVAISFISMIVVVISGLTGRYLYAHVPRTINGQIRSLQALQKERADLLDTLKQETGLSDEAAHTLFPPENLTSVNTFGAALKKSLLSPFDKRRKKKWILQQATTYGIAPRVQKEFRRLMLDQLRMERHIALLTPFQKVFRYWITIHVPLTIVMGIVVLLHIGVAVAFGYVINF